MIYVIIALSLFCLYWICCAFGLLDDSDERTYWTHMNNQARFEDKLNKLLKNVTDIEWTFYRKVFNKIKYTDQKNWEVLSVKNYNKPLEPSDIYEIQIGSQLCLRTLKVSDDKDRLKYECTGLELLDGGKCDISIIPPKEQMEIYDLFVNYALYRLDLYYTKIQEDEKKKISEEHQNLIKEANKKFVI